MFSTFALFDSKAKAAHSFMVPIPEVQSWKNDLVPGEKTSALVIRKLAPELVGKNVQVRIDKGLANVEFVLLVME